MARPLRIEYPGAIYHVLSRGDRREAIFRTEAHRKLFLDLLDQTCRRTGWQIHAYCLMDNHFHLVVETPRGNLSTGMQWFPHPAIQSPSPFVGSSFWGPLQSASGGWPPRRRISAASLRLCAFESRARRDTGQQRESASLSLE